MRERHIDYNAIPSLQPFHQSRARVRCVRGPVGCLPAETEFLTPDGWKRIADYKPGDLVAQWHEEGLAEFVKPTRYIMDCCDEMIRFSGSLTMVLSENHRVPLYDYQGKFVVKTAAELEAKPSRHTIPVHFMTVDGLGLSDDEIRLRVLVAADGHYPKHGRKCTVTLRKKRKKRRLKAILDSLGIEWDEYRNSKRPTEVRYTFERPDFAKHLHESANWYQASSTELEVLLEEALFWDGLWRHPEQRYYTNKCEEADVVQFAAHATGRTARIRCEEYDKPGWGKTYTVQWAEAHSRKNAVGFRGDNMKIDRIIPNDGQQYCFVVPTGFFIVRHEGRVFVTGNSGKTTAMLQELFRIACEQAPDPNDGIRRTRFLITRNTLPQLKSTCLESIMGFFRGIAQWRPSDSLVRFHFGDVESDWMLLPLDTPQNIARLLSLELTAAWASEFRELAPDLMVNVLSRCGRFPAKRVGGPTWYGLMMESNSFRVDSPWFDILENNLPSNWEYFIQPGARSAEADWLHYLTDTYYDDLVESNPPDWVDQYVDNHLGYSLDGQAVYKNSFIPDFHIAPKGLRAIPGMPLCVGMDFARHPAAVFTQLDPAGGLSVLGEVERENVGVEKFLLEEVAPVLASDRYRRCPSYIIGDPSGVRRSEIGEESVFKMLNRHGYSAYPATTNLVDPRLRAVEKWLLQQRDGKAALRVDPSCKVLIEGFRSKYRFKIKKSNSGEVLDDKPDKTQRPWADVHDALQYACLGTDHRVRARAMQNLRGQESVYQPPKIPVGAWT